MWVCVSWRMCVRVCMLILLLDFGCSRLTRFLTRDLTARFWLLDFGCSILAAQLWLLDFACSVLAARFWQPIRAAILEHFVCFCFVPVWGILWFLGVFVNIWGKCKRYFGDLDRFLPLFGAAEGNLTFFSGAQKV